MKQLLIGLGVFVVFVAYSLGVRHEQPPVVRVSSVTAPPTSSGGVTPPAAVNQKPSGQNYKDGNYTGSVADAFYGSVQVTATIAGGQLSDVVFLQYPSDHTDSVLINQQAMPLLKQEAIQKQSASVDIISGATFTSQAFIQSLGDALAMAKA